MDSIRICMLALTGVTAITLVKKWSSDFLPLLRLCMAILLSAVLLSLAAPTVAYIKSLTETGGISGYAAVLLRALGVAVLTECCAELCRESGEGGIATGVELAGRLEILLLSLPLIGEILDTAKQLLTLAG